MNSIALATYIVPVCVTVLTAATLSVTLVFTEIIEVFVTTPSESLIEKILVNSADKQGICKIAVLTVVVCFAAEVTVLVVVKTVVVTWQASALPRKSPSISIVLHTRCSLQLPQNRSAIGLSLGLGYADTLEAIRNPCRIAGAGIRSTNKESGQKDAQNQMKMHGKRKNEECNA
jgi:hypothetical protein